MAELKEYLLATNSFDRPKVLTNKDAIYTLIIRLILLEPGTYQTHPEMGVGLISKYRYSDTIDLNLLRSDIREQIRKYLPMLVTNEVNIVEDEKLVHINVSIDNTLYQINLDKETKTLQDLKI